MAVEFVLSAMKGPLRIAEFDTVSGSIVAEYTTAASACSVNHTTGRFVADRAFAVRTLA